MNNSTITQYTEVNFADLYNIQLPTISSKLSINADSVNLWYININNYDANSQRYDCLEGLNDDEKKKIMKYYFQDDRKRCLMSMLLQKAVVKSTFKITDNDFEICRTAEVKK
jgi:predicted secreted protein